MDELKFDPANTTNTDSTMQVEGLQDQIVDIQNAYPEQDWRTPAQIEAEEQTQTSQPEAQSQGQVPTPEITPEVGGQETEVTPTEVVDEELEPFDWSKPRLDTNDHFWNMKANEDEYGYVPTEFLKDRNGKQFIDGIRRTQNLNWSYIEKEHKDWETYKENGGDANLENQLWMINNIRDNPEMLVRHDRNGDGKFTISDWHDMSRANGGKGLTPEQDEELTEKWLAGLQNKSWVRRGKGFLRQRLADGILWDGGGHLDTNMARFTNTRRLQAL